MFQNSRMDKSIFVQSLYLYYITWKYVFVSVCVVKRFASYAVYTMSEWIEYERGKVGYRDKKNEKEKDKKFILFPL